MTKPKQNPDSSVQLYPDLLATPVNNNKEYTKQDQDGSEQNAHIQQRLDYNSAKPKEVANKERDKLDTANADMIMML